MKLNRIKNLTGYFLLAGALVLASCEGNETPGPQGASILPDRFGVNIPESISDEDAASGSRLKNGRVKEDTLQGGDIYNHLATFIHIGEGASEIVEDLIVGIRIYGIDRPMILSYESDEDGRTKNLVVEENPTFDGEDWEYMLTITDAESEANDDGGVALQLFWNRSPIKGIAMIKPFNLNRRDEVDALHAAFRIDYSEEGADNRYDVTMGVSIVDLPIPSPLDDPYAMDNLKMFVGKSGDEIDVYGNSNHPNAVFFTNDNLGFNWAFVASGNDATDLGAAKVGLPPSNLDEPSGAVLLDYYSIKNVFTREISAVWPDLSEEIIAAYLYNTEGPGFFGPDGFIQGGESPGPEWDILAERLESLSPFNPKEIKNLEINFKLN